MHASPVTVRPSFRSPERVQKIATALVLVFLAAGCSDSGPTDPLDEDCHMTARIDGEPFCGLFLDVQRSSNQVYVNSGAAGARAIGFTFPDQGPATYTIGVGSLVAAGVTIGSAHFTAGGGTGSGSIVITTLTADRVAGTFQITAVGASTVEVTAGAFDSGS